MAITDSRHLNKVLKPIHLWAIGVGLVISGDYFGWNLGWAVSGTIGFLIATLIITLLYITFIFSYTELTTAIPHTGGAFAYAYRAMGPIGGLIAGYATLIDFLFATPAIAFGLGAYVHFLYPNITVINSAIFFNIIFILINIWGIKESAIFSVFITLLAVAELLMFMGVVSPHFKLHNFLNNPLPFGFSGVFAALPYAVWFYLAIEGVAMVAEEVKDPRRNIPIGYISALITMVLLALGVMIFTGGITDWHKFSALDYPLPAAISEVLGKGSHLTGLFTCIGLFGLIASFHGTILGSSRQVYAMARSGYLPRVLSQLSQKFKTPHWALIAGGLISILALYTGTTQQIVILSVMGAIMMYMLSMISLFILRKKEPNLLRPFKAPFYPLFPAIALLISAITFFTMIYYNFMLSLVFFSGLVIIVFIFILLGKHKIELIEDFMVPPINQELIKNR